MSTIRGLPFNRYLLFLDSRNDILMTFFWMSNDVDVSKDYLYVGLCCNTAFHSPPILSLFVSCYRNTSIFVILGLLININRSKFSSHNLWSCI